MAKYKFYQDKEVTTWVRDYFEVEANSLEEAIKYVENMRGTFDEDECRVNTQVEFDYRDDECFSYGWGEEFSGRYSICCAENDDEIICKL
jgi:hypothetical protein